MNIKHAAVTLAALSVFAAPALALADGKTPDVPVVISSAIFETAVAGAELNYPALGSVSLEFHNTRAVAATDVTFEVAVFGSPIDEIHDVGTFSKGTTIRHRFVDQSTFGHQTIAVAAVKYADGSVWTAGDDAAPSALRQTALR